MMGSSSSWSGQNFVSFSSSPGSGLWQTVGSISATPWGVSEKGSRVCAYVPTTDDDPSKHSYLKSISAMLVYSNKSHEELRHEDYERGDRGVSEKGSRVCAYAPTTDDDASKHSYLKSISAMLVYSNKSHEELRHEDYERGDRGVGGDSLQKSITPGPIFPVPSSPSFGLSCSSTPSFTSSPTTRFVAPFPASIEHWPAELQPSTRGPTSSSNPFWLPPAVPQSSFSSGDFKSSTQGLSYSTSGLSVYRYLPSKLASMGIQTPPPSHTDFQKNPSTYCPSSHPSPFTAHVGGAHSASAWTPSMKGTSSQNFPTTPTQPGKSPSVGSSLAHSEPALSSDAHCTSVNVDYPNNIVELHLPVTVRTVRIRFMSSNGGAGTSQVHSDRVSKASEAPISLSIYPGENHELTIQSMEQTAKSHTGKESSSTDGSDHIKVHNSTGHPPSRSAWNQDRSNGDAHLIQKSAAAPARELITRSVLPRLYNADYYTVPSIVELAVKESDEPGYCSRVPDFTIGRHGYGSIKFDGETDVQKLDIASIVEFNNREILVYRDESRTPPVGQGLNKPAEVTLLNVKCIDQKTGLQFTGGLTVDRYKEILVQWTKEHNAEFVSFDPVKGEWKFKVKNFSQ